MKLLLNLAIITILLVVPVSASAHVLESQGSIGAVLHVDPDDDPVAGERSGIFFEFKDKTNRFKPQDCDCRLKILQAGRAIYDQPFTQLSGGEFTFPTRDTYIIKAVGAPKTADAFDSFELSYDIRVERGADQAAAPATENKNKNIQLAALGGGVAIIVFALAAVRYKITKQAKK